MKKLLLLISVLGLLVFSGCFEKEESAPIVEEEDVSVEEEEEDV